MQHVVGAPPMWQGSIFGAGAPGIADTPLRRENLDADSWLDFGAGWLTGADAVFAHLVAALPWRGGSRPMYDKMVTVPRLTAFIELDHAALPDVVRHAAVALGERYGRRFEGVGANYYRTGADSVAWHRDRVGRVLRDPPVAVLSLGGQRAFRLRPRSGGPAHGITMHSGDLLVMGGACQHRWEHAVPKMAFAEPRLSLTFRERSADPNDRSWAGN